MREAGVSSLAHCPFYPHRHAATHTHQPPWQAMPRSCRRRLLTPSDSAWVCARRPMSDAAIAQLRELPGVEVSEEEEK